MQHPFVELATEYESWVAQVVPNPDRLAEIDAVARRLTRPEALENFAAITDLFAIPQIIQATICEREDGCDFTKNPGQGDPLTHPSVHIPRGRPPLGAPPNDRFPVTWIYAASDAFTVCDKLNVNSAPWSMPYACFKWEFWNGGGYRAHGIRTPYVVGGTNLQQPGKYVADGVFDPNHMDSQLGCLPVAVRMIELVPSLSFGQAIASAAAPSIIPAVLPLPAAVGGNLTGTKWIQSSLNTLQNAELTVDGSFGRQTRAAIRIFDEAHGLPPDGFITDELCTAIDAALAAQPAQPAKP